MRLKNSLKSVSCCIMIE